MALTRITINEKAGTTMRARVVASMAAGLVLTALTSTVAVADKIFVYQRVDGSRLISDHMLSDPSLKLVRRYGIRVPRGNGTHSAYTTSFHKGTSRGASRSKFVARKKASEFDELIATKARQHGVDSALVKAVVQVESAYNPGAVSPKGATGLMQLMPGTAAKYGVKNRKDPNENVDAGVQHLRYLLTIFADDVRLALAAYNAGENAVLRYRDIPPYRETLDYVDRVLQLHNLYASN